MFSLTHGTICVYLSGDIHAFFRNNIEYILIPSIVQGISYFVRYGQHIAFVEFGSVKTVIL